jgi:hypothetical protein
MMRTAVTVIATAAVTVAAVHIHGGLVQPGPASGSDAVIRRLDGLERAVSRLAEVRHEEASVQLPALPPHAEASRNVEQEAQRESAMRAGNAVIEQIVSAGRISTEDDVALAAAIADLSGDDQVAVMSRLSMAINEGRVQVRRPHP